MMPEKENITIYDIAREAGVSPATVSRIITGSAAVSSEKRERVIKLVKKYHFVPNQMARGLTIKQSKTIGMLLSDIRNPFYSELYVGVESAAVKRGYNVMLCNALNDDNIERQHMKMLIGKNVDIIFLCGGETDNIKPSEKQLKLIARAKKHTKIIIAGSAEYYKCSRIEIDDSDSVHSLIDYLINLGHEKFALIGGDKNKHPTAIKRLLFKEILEEKGILFRSDWVMETPHYDTPSGYMAAAKLFNTGDYPTAILGINELVAMGVIKAASEAGIKVPDELSVAGFDDTYLADMYSPTITSAGCDYVDYGEKLLDLIIEAMNSKSEDLVVTVPSKLTIRKSCAKVNV